VADVVPTVAEPRVVTIADPGGTGPGYGTVLAPSFTLLGDRFGRGRWGARLVILAVVPGSHDGDGGSGHNDDGGDGEQGEGEPAGRGRNLGVRCRSWPPPSTTPPKRSSLSP
jgi:hypothetical protein